MGSTGEADPDATPFTRDAQPLAHHRHRARALIASAHELSRWRDPTPVKAAEKRRWQAHKHAILHRPTRLAISHYRDRAASRFERHRGLRLVAPYRFGEPTIPFVAIPPAIIYCETRGYYGAGRWQAVNASSGARGPYQLLPSTYYGVCRSCDWSHLDQHRAAAAVYARSGGSEWACA